jgi:hypothetical protein
MMARVAYITSLGHSGSTLLDLMIAAHSRTLNIGEVKSLRRYARRWQLQRQLHHIVNHVFARCGFLVAATCRIKFLCHSSLG